MFSTTNTATPKGLPKTKHEKKNVKCSVTLALKSVGNEDQRKNTK
jgi:hypothetical protein